MERFVEGYIVIIYFPFSDLSGLKKRPALLIRKIAGNDFILCQITRKSFCTFEEILMKNNDFLEGNLKEISYVRFTKLFTANESIISYKIGKIKSEKLYEITKNLCTFIGKNI